MGINTIGDEGHESVLIGGSLEDEGGMKLGEADGPNSGGAGASVGHQDDGCRWRGPRRAQGYAGNLESLPPLKGMGFIAPLHPLAYNMPVLRWQGLVPYLYLLPSGLFLALFVLWMRWGSPCSADEHAA